MRPYQENLILLGDFNSTLGKSTGRTNNRALTELVSGLKLLNTSTLTNTSRNQFTFRSKLGQSCIDHILIGEENRAAVTAFKTLPYAASDHELVMLEINFGSNQTKPRKHKSPYWKFNVSLLDDPDFKEAFTRFLTSAEEENSYTFLSATGGSKILNEILSTYLVILLN